MLVDVAYSVDNVPIRLTAERWFHIVENHTDRPEKGAMETRLTARVTEPIFRAVPHLLGFPSRRFWVDYDAEADVLYISLDRPQQVTDSVMTDDGVLLRYRKDRLVGVTILEASARGEDADAIRV